MGLREAWQLHRSKARLANDLLLLTKKNPELLPIFKEIHDSYADIDSILVKEAYKALEKISEIMGKGQVNVDTYPGHLCIVHKPAPPPSKRHMYLHDYELELGLNEIEKAIVTIGNYSDLLLDVAIRVESIVTHLHPSKARLTAVQEEERANELKMIDYCQEINDYLDHVQPFINDLRAFPEEDLFIFYSWQKPGKEKMNNPKKAKEAFAVAELLRKELEDLHKNLRLLRDLIKRTMK